MAAPIGNKYALGSDNGRPKAFKSPEHLWDTFLEYVKAVKHNPKMVQDFVGKDADEVYRRREVPLTIEGFNIYCYSRDIIADTHDYFSNKEGRYKDFATVCARIKESIREDQITGGMVGIYNPSITARLNGLTDKQSIDHSGEIKTFNVGKAIADFMKDDRNTKAEDSPGEVDG